MTANDGATTTFYDEIGGEETITRIVAAFYRGVAEDPYLRAIYPEEDLGPAEERFRLFLIQYWGGPTTYSERRGHPRLRARHAPFHIGSAQRDAWLRHMRAAVDSLELPEPYERTRNAVDDAFACYIGATSGPEQVVDSRADLHSYVSSKEFTMNCAAWVT